MYRVNGKIEKDLPMIELAVVIVTFNGMRWIGKCLDTVSQSTVPAKVILVDNCSTDGTASFVKESHPAVTVIVSEENLGFGGANNLGMRRAIDEGASHLLLLNQDAYIAPTMLEELLRACRANRDFGVLSPLQFNGTGADFDRHFSTQLKLSGISQQDIKRAQKKGTNTVLPVKFVMAAMWLLPANCVQAVGGFDPIFPHYGEDDDYIKRVLFHRFKVGVCATATGFHDREDRNVPKEKKLHIAYTRYLYIAKDINRNFLICLLIILSIFCGKSIKFLVHFEVKLFLKNFRYLCQLVSKLPTIHNHRTRCTRRGLTFLENIY